jgi:hypothetical protein
MSKLSVRYHAVRFWSLHRGQFSTGYNAYRNWLKNALMIFLMEDIMREFQHFKTLVERFAGKISRFN